MIETDEDLQSYFDTGEFALTVDVQGIPTNIVGVFDRNFDNSLDINGRRTGMRVMNFDVTQYAIAVGTVLTLYKNTADEQQYTVRALETGARTTLLILEQL